MRAAACRSSRSARASPASTATDRQAVRAALRVAALAARDIDGGLGLDLSLGAEMSDAVKNARTSLEGDAGAYGVVLVAQGLADDAVNLRENFERRLVFGRGGLHDVDGGA